MPDLPLSEESRPRVNRRTADVRAAITEEKWDESDPDAIPIVGFERTIEEYSKIGEAWLARKRT